MGLSYWLIRKSDFRPLLHSNRNVLPKYSFYLDVLFEVFQVAIVGEIDENGLQIEFVKLDERMFEKYDFFVDEMTSPEELVEKISDLKLNDKNLYEIVLQGNRQFDIRPREILKLIEPQNILKIKDETQIGVDVEQIAKEHNLRGIFIREIIKKYQEGNYSDEQIKKAIEIGLEVM